MLELKFTDAGLRAGAQHGHLSPLRRRGFALVKLKDLRWSERLW